MTTREQKDNRIECIIQGNRKGFAFACPVAGGEDIFVPHSALCGACHGDRVLVSRNHDEGRVSKILARGKATLVGCVVRINHSGAFVAPDNDNYMYDVYVPSVSGTVKRFDRVLVQITEYPHDGGLVGEIVRVLGASGERETDILAILAEQGFDVDFPAGVLSEAERKQPITLDDRYDYRELFTVTIDGEDAKDFDDAVSLCRTDNGYRLYVHIADVSHYVREGRPLDREAYLRGTSVYLPDRVLPMLPVRLSNDLCSLNPDTDKAVLTAELTLDNRGKTVSLELREGVIRSNYRLTYTRVSSILNGTSTDETDEFLVGQVCLMRELATKLRAIRTARGAVDFETKESVFTLNAEGEPIDVRAYEYGESNAIIEEFMLAANEAVAKFAFDRHIPAVYRIHEAPPDDKLSGLTALLRTIGVRFDAGTPTPQDFQRLLAEVHDAPYAAVVNKIALRSMSKARYSEKHQPHFGLAAEYYAHFTSPIRRYPDLVLHRMLKAYLHGDIHEGDDEKLTKKMQRAADQSTSRERAAETVERACDDYFRALYMQAHVGERFSGTISSVTPFGLFVELPNTVEGLVPIADIDENARYDDRAFSLTTRDGAYAIGDTMDIIVVSSSTAERRIRFMPYGSQVSQARAMPNRRTDTPPRRKAAPPTRNSKSKSHAKQSNRFRRGSGHGRR